MTAVTATVRPPRIRWVAGADGEAHAHVGPRPVRTACGRPQIDERFAWPTATTCEACAAVVRELDS